MTEFTATFDRDGLLDVHHPASGVTFGFSILVDPQGRLDLLGPIVMGVAVDQPDSEVEERAIEFAWKAAAEHRRKT